MANERYKIINASEHKEWLAGSPLKIGKGQLLFDNQGNKVILQIKLFNLSDKIIKSVYLDIDCYDDAMDFLSSINDFAIQGIDAKPQSHFGDRQPIILESPKTTNVKIIISKVVFEDGSVWRNDEKNLGVELPEQKIIDPNDTLYGQAVRECNEKGIKSVYWLEENTTYWRCTCGQPNANDVLQCGYCKADKQWLERHLDKRYLLEANARFMGEEEIRKSKLAEEEQKRLEESAAKKKKQIRFAKIIAAFTAICVVAVISIGIITDNTYSYKYYKLKQLNGYDQLGYTQLISSIIKGDNETAKNLIEKGVDLNKGTLNENNTPLIEASRLGNFEIAKILVEHGADINLKNNNGSTALIFAVDKEQYEITKLLVEHGADLDVLAFDEATGQKRTALIIAAEKGNSEIAKLLIEHGAKGSNGKVEGTADSTLNNDIITKPDNNKDSYVSNNQELTFLTYYNRRYGFTIDYPNNFIKGDPPFNGDGLEFTSPDGQSKLIAYGTNNLAGETAQMVYNQEIINSDVQFSYKTLQNNWFILSWLEGNKIYYSKTIVGKGSINKFIFSYSKNAADLYEKGIPNINSSFAPGNLGASH